MNLSAHEVRFEELDSDVRYRLKPEIQELKNKIMFLEGKIYYLENDVNNLKMFIKSKFPEDHI